MSCPFTCVPAIENCELSGQELPIRLRGAKERGFRVYSIDDCYATSVIHYGPKRADYAIVGSNQMVILEHKEPRTEYKPEFDEQLKGGLDIIRKYCGYRCKITLVVLCNPNPHIPQLKQPTIRGCSVLVSASMPRVWKSVLKGARA